ncbi:MAG TPA: alpha/beta fold hydrolase [Solirubrobacteraceae bacterium]|jgi:pimeloyl-ACP methyl ester carboxylesterase|nr:alpha/beta fold hydrolase [Solirubrobacteraceae bacterium]
MEPLHEHSMPLDGHRTRVLEVQGDGPGIVLLHGWGDSADTWRPLLAELASIGRRAIAVDLPGFGSASALARGPLLPQLDAFAAALVLEWGGGEPVVVAGASLGGAVALRLAEQGDLPIAGVVPVSPAGLERPGWFDRVERDPIVRRLLDLPMPVPSALIRSLVGADARLDPRAAQRDVVLAFATHHGARRSAAALLDSGRSLLPELATAPFDLAAVACPVLLVWGAHDRLVPDSGARVVLDALPATRVELIEGCGRAPQVEAADRLLELLVAFPA